MLYFAPWKIVLILAVCLFGLVFTAPNFVSRQTAESLPTWLPHKQINLGLDLQGGAHLLLEIDAEAVLRERLENLVSEVRTEMRDERIRYRGLGIDGRRSVAITIINEDETERATELLRDLATPVNPNPLVGITGGASDLTVAAGEGGRVRVTLTEEALQGLVDSAVRQIIEILRRRVDEFGVAEASIQRQGADRVLLQLPGVDDPDRVKQLIGKTAKMTFRLVDVNADPTAGRPPPGTEILYEETPGGQQIPYVVKKRVEVSGEHLVDAQPTFDRGQPVVSFRFDTVGARRFGETTRENIGRPFAIVLDGKVISAPVIRDAILGGSGIISGRFTVEEANDLALLLRAGALPAPVEFIEERTVGPDLGADSIAAGKIASVIGFALVVVFMVLAYGPFGIAANVALITNLFIILGVLSLLQATLTLPGIAGIVLTIGMAVDANVLIFERIREELRSGKSPFSAVEAGYKRAFTTIVDANVTTGIAAAILFAFGSGPVKGFAVTLGIGILSSMFTATMLTRLMVASWLRRRRPATLVV